MIEAIGMGENVVAGFIVLAVVWFAFIVLLAWFLVELDGKRN